jgi:hypothetical protein
LTAGVRRDPRLFLAWGRNQPNQASNSPDRLSGLLKVGRQGAQWSRALLGTVESREKAKPMMMGFVWPMMLGMGSFMMTMFDGFFDVFFMPMWTMMTGWFGFTF